MLVRQVTIPAGTGFTSILATIPAHHLRIVEDVNPQSTTFDVQWPDDSFAVTHVYGPGRPIEHMGHGFQGILAPPPGYFAANTPATGGVYVKIRDHSGTGTVVRVIESETAIFDDVI